MEFLRIFGFVAFIFLMFFGSYLLNKNTKPPMEIVVEGGCAGCRNRGCGFNEAHNSNKEEN